MKKNIASTLLILLFISSPTLEAKKDKSTKLTKSKKAKKKSTKSKKL